MNPEKYRVAIYCRLSKEDGNEESQSIQSQKEILNEYVKKQEWNIVDYYVDDGYSGTSFERPDFKRLLKDIEIGKIDLVITKDLSRLGRNYIQTGYYTEDFFPSHGIRYIALNDGYDSEKEEGADFAPFKNIINEWYAKDISKKIRFTLDNKAKKGEPQNTVFPIFGYTYNDFYERVPDSDTAKIVQLIYKKYVEFGSSVKVANYLKKEKIKTPRYYNALKFNYNKDKVFCMSEDELTNWRPDGIRDIIGRKEYLGCYITAQTRSQNYKNKKRKKNENCYIFENRYEPIIDKETWELANKIMNRTRSGRIPMSENVFKGLIFCEDCKNLMRFERRKIGEKYIYRYFCAKKDCFHSNSIPVHIMKNIIDKELLELINLILSKRNQFVEFSKLLRNNKRIIKIDSKKEMEKLLQRDAEIDSYIKMLFEKNVAGIIPASTFEMMMSKYNREKNVLFQEIKKLKENQQKEFLNKKNEEKSDFLIKILEKIKKNKELLSNFAQRIIKKIYIKSKPINGSNRNKEYNISILFSRCDDIIKEFISYEKCSSNLC